MLTLGDVDVVVLAGGRGERLRGVLGGIPKVLAPVAGGLFLDRLLCRLESHGARQVILALGFGSDAVLEYLASRPFSALEIVPVIEERLLGTAGAIANAAAVLYTDPVMVMNGDTHIEADLNAFLAEHERTSSTISIICVQVANPGRYGRVEIDTAGNVLSFREKDPSATGRNWINAGGYLLGQAILRTIARDVPSGSLERDVLENLPGSSIHAFRTEGAFLDIGTPDDLVLAGRLS